MKGWRTVTFNILMAVVGVVVLTRPDAADGVPDASAINAALDHVEALYPFVVTLGNVLLRAVTNTAIFRRNGE